jgi:hypothetical protein
MSKVVDMSGKPFESEPWDQRQPFDGTALYCVLCNYLDDVVVGANVIVEGTSLCAEHGRDVVKRAAYIWRRPDNTFSLDATVQHCRQANEQ